MRMRRKPWAQPELEACPFFLPYTPERRGNWHAAFPRRQPMWLELGCGKGGFLAAMALAHPEVNFLGLDMISNVLGVARRNIAAAFGDRPVNNLRLCAYDITRLPDVMEERDTVERIFINFCNPWYKQRDYKKRLTHPKQLALYTVILPPGGEIWFKTDDEALFRDSLTYFAASGFEVIWQTQDLHESGRSDSPPTEHERMYAAEGKKIRFCIARRLPRAEGGSE